MICTYYYTQVFRKKLVWLQKIWTLAYILSLYFDCWWHIFSLPITALTVVVHPLYLLKHDVIYYSNVLLHNIYTLLHCVCSYFVASFYVKSIHRNDFSKKWTYSALHLEVDYLQKQWFSHAFTYLLQDFSFLAYCYFLNLKGSCKNR